MTIADDDFFSDWASNVDLSDPPELLLKRLHPTDYTILFGDGGVGKGVIAAWWAARLIKDLGYVVVVLDFEENTAYEWAPRVKQFGGDLKRLRVIQTAHAIWSATDRIKEDLEVVRAEYPGAPIYVIVDSIGYACGDARVEESGTATKYKKALNEIGHLPTLSLAHTTSADAGDATKPFGSRYWHNGVRVTIGVAAKSSDVGAPRVLTNRKSNQRAKFPTVEIDWSHEVEGQPMPTSLTESAFKTSAVSASQRCAVVLASGPMPIDDIVRAVNADGGDTLTRDTVSRALQRGIEFSSDGKKTPTWTLFNPKVSSSKRTP